MSKFVLYVLLCISTVLVFQNTLRFSPLSAGDWGYHYTGSMDAEIVIPTSWQPLYAHGLGANGLLFLPLESFFIASTHLLQSIGLEWILIERLLWYWPFIFISLVSSFILARSLFPSSKFNLLSSFIYLFNTYSLMLVGGGQMGVALAYAISPLVFKLFIDLLDGVIDDRKFLPLRSLAFTLVYAILVLFDYRIALVMSIPCFGWGVFRWFSQKSTKRVTRVFLYGILIPFVCLGTLYAFWWFPLVSYPPMTLETLGGAYTSSDAVKYFSFADFPHTLGLLHPNWPENIFGKTFFMQPEFLLLPILAFASLLFASPSRRRLLTLATLALLGAFLSKGSLPPLGNLYLWMFEHVPGFILFRDPTKFYVLIAISYSLLIPQFLHSFSDWGAKRLWRDAKKTEGFIFLLMVILLLLLSREAISGKLSGTYKIHKIPEEYRVLKDFLYTQNSYFRTLWIPMRQRYGFTSYNHPGIDALNVSDTDDVSQWLQSDNAHNRLEEWAVQYIIVPIDTQGELFLEDRKYDVHKREALIQTLDTIPWIEKIPEFTEMGVYKVDSIPKLFSMDGDTSVSWVSTKPSEYYLNFPPSTEIRKMVFSQNFDPYWNIQIDGVVTKSTKTVSGLNSFLIPTGVSQASLVYVPQDSLKIGLVVSIFSFVIITLAFFCLVSKSRYGRI